jgi:hypothetical protein
MLKQETLIQEKLCIIIQSFGWNHKMGKYLRSRNLKLGFYEIDEIDHCVSCCHPSMDNNDIHDGYIRK